MKILFVDWIETNVLLILLVDELIYNLYSISQLYNTENRVTLEPSHCRIEDIHDNQIKLIRIRHKDII